MSRPMNDAEVAAFRARYGYAPLRITVAHDAIAIFADPDNPMTHITLAQVDAIWSGYHRCANAPGDGAIARGLLVNGRDASSGTYELFRETALCGGAYRPGVIAWPGNGAVIAAVATQRNAIGYAGAGYVNALVKPLAIARDDADEAVAPDARDRVRPLSADACVVSVREPETRSRTVGVALRSSNTPVGARSTPAAERRICRARRRRTRSAARGFAMRRDRGSTIRHIDVPI
jgi:phosphate transport system substrate-binding protein